MFDVTLYNAVKEVMNQEKCDVVHLHEPLTPLLPYIVLLNSQSANVATFHAARATNPWYSMLKPYFGFLMSRLNSRISTAGSASPNRPER
jgi:phosphatidylinositol alpha-mannosyltransferase